MDEQQARNQELSEKDFSEQEAIRREKLQKMIDAGNSPYSITKFELSSDSQTILQRFEEMEGQDVRIAGRILSRRIMGKAAFAHILDGAGKLQVYIKRDDIGTEEYQDFKQMDIGDIIGIEGFVFRTQKGEISVHAKKLTLLTKSLKPLPEKYHGLKDTDLRYRQRYLDMIVNPEVKDVFIKRSRIISAVREFLDARGFIEVDTPVLQTIEIGAAAKTFKTHHNALDIDMFLRIETELYLKRLIVGGMNKVYEVGRLFRNEGMDATHNPEFTSVETYQAYVDYQEVMNMVEELYSFVAMKTCGSTDIPCGEHTIHLQAPWPRLTMVDAVKQYAGVDYHAWSNNEEARACAKEHHVEVEKDHSKGDVLAAFFDAFVEDKLIQPVFITDYPVAISPLAKRKPEDSEFTERFEFFIDCREMGNAFSELNDPIDQRRRFEEQVAKRRAEGVNASIDEDFLNALEYGMPPTGGLGFGIDRMVMLFTNQSSIRDVLLFPTMKTIGGQKDSERTGEKSNEIAQEAAPKVEEKIDFSNVVIEPLLEDSIDFETFSKSDFRAVKVLECVAVPKSKKLLQFTLDDGTGVNRTILSGIHTYYEPEELIGKTLIAITNLPPRAMMGIESCGMLLSAINKRGEEEELNLLMVDNRIPAGAKLY